MKRHGCPHILVTDKLRSYGAAMKVIGNADRQETGRWLNNRAENSHLPFRRRERAMQRSRSKRTLQKFVTIHASVHNHFNQERHLYSRSNFKLNRTAALADGPSWAWHKGQPHCPCRASSHLSDTTNKVTREPGHRPTMRQSGQNSFGQVRSTPFLLWRQVVEKQDG